MERVSKCSPFESQTETQPKSNTEAEMKEEKEERMEESKSDDEEKGSFSSDEKKKGKQPMKEKKQKQKYRNINEMMYGPGGKPIAIVIGDRVSADEFDSEKPPASKRRKSSYSLRSENKDSEEKEPKGKEKEEETDQKGKKIAEGSDGESDSFSLEPEMQEIYIQLEELSW